MRFIKNGPSIPDELLTARDEGRVVFFCGAGVSRARAGLKDFLGLADEVVDKLHVDKNDPIQRVLKEIRRVEKKCGVSGLISVDRVFGLLERDFFTDDIEENVAKVLKPIENVDLSAHKTLIDLATTPSGKIQLVTTNFDRLFDDCCKAEKIWQPPRLPNVNRNEGIDGIVYLHGCAKKDYSGSESTEFVLSSSQFGKAYLADGWATKFLREVMEHYVVVFVGYSADDPPVQYLLEALNKKDTIKNGVYAFQEGSPCEAAARWNHKGVEAIPFSNENKYKQLWDTLEAWAERARNPDEWYEKVFKKARKGPEKMQAFERGQVAHIVSTIQGSRRFSEAHPPLPAEWLCVFDPKIRYSTPYKEDINGENSKTIDPFEIYGLDSDFKPEKFDTELYHYSERKIQENEWDAFAIVNLDKRNLPHDRYASINGEYSIKTPFLTPRLANIAEWFINVADQPIAPWWAAKQRGLHPYIKTKILFKMLTVGRFSDIIRKAWHYIFECFENQCPTNIHNSLCCIREELNICGWDTSFLRRFMKKCMPSLMFSTTFYGQRVPKNFENNYITEIIGLGVEYPDILYDIDVPDEWLGPFVKELRYNIEHAIKIANEAGCFNTNFSPIIQDEDPEICSLSRSRDISGLVIYFSQLFERLVEIDCEKAKQEFLSWQADDYVFCRLRVWAIAKDELFNLNTFSEIMVNLSDKFFWSEHNQRDLLFSLSNHWNKLNDEIKIFLENRLLKGWAKDVDEIFYKEASAWQILNRIQWLSNKGCLFKFNIGDEIGRLKLIVPEWQPEKANQAVRSMEIRGGTVSTESGCEELLKEPVQNILKKAKEITGRTDSVLLEKDPFSGLSAKFPLRAFTALHQAIGENEYSFFWRKFLYHGSRIDDSPRLKALIAERISIYPIDDVIPFFGALCEWMVAVWDDLHDKYPNSFIKIIERIISIIECNSIYNEENNFCFDWLDKAINSYIGKIAGVLCAFEAKSQKSIIYEKGSRSLYLMEKLLLLNDDRRRHTIAVLTQHLKWFFFHFKNWTSKNLLSILNSKDLKDKDAFWSGFLFEARPIDLELHNIIKPHMLEGVKGGKISGDVVAKLLLMQWAAVKNTDESRQYITDNELMNVILKSNDKFREKILLRIQKNLSTPPIDWLNIANLFFNKVWPTHKVVKNSTTTKYLCNLILSNKNIFPNLLEAVIPHMTVIEDERVIIPYYITSDEDFICNYSKEIISLLSVILPGNGNSWSENIGNTIEYLGEKNKNLRSDPKYLSLRNRWDMR